MSTDLRRARPVGQKDRLEDQDLKFYEAVAAGYRSLANHQPQRVKLIDASGTREQIFARIQEEFRRAFPALPR